MSGNGQPVAAVAHIEIVMAPNGTIECRYQGPGRDVFNMMLARATQDMLPKFLEQENKKVVEPPPGLALALGR